MTKYIPQYNKVLNKTHGEVHNNIHIRNHIVTINFNSMIFISFV